MNFTLRLTLDGLIGALRMKAHSLADRAESRPRPQSLHLPETDPGPDVKGLSRRKGESNDLAGR